MSGEGERWIKFLRQYGPIPRNDNMFDEHIRRSAGRLSVAPVVFQHPLEDDLLAYFAEDADPWGAVLLTGTAGDGKSHLCARVWQSLGGSPSAWSSNDIYFQLPLVRNGQPYTLHVIRDLTALPSSDEEGRYETKTDLLLKLSAAVFQPNMDLFLIAANDGQLLETWRGLGSAGDAPRAHALFEARLMGDEDPDKSAKLGYLNLSAIPSAGVLKLSLDALLSHEGWQACYADAEPDGFFGPHCPIRHNYELLLTPLVQSRLQSLFRLLDFNELHTPVRRVLMLLTNAILGHPRAKDRLLSPRDIKELVTRNDIFDASLYGNLFGANLSGTKRESLEIFDYLSRFGIGQETTNRIDNILIFGAEDENLHDYYDSLMASDEFYGATDRYQAAQHAYVEAPEATVGDRHLFLEMLVAQRRGLFFKIPLNLAEDLNLWRLTVFTFAGDYLEAVAGPLIEGARVPRHVVAGLVNGLNRIFTGMMVTSQRELLLATSLSFSTARVSQLLEDRIAVASRGRPEKVEVTLRRGFPFLDVHLPNGEFRSLRLDLTRYEFLMRVSVGALPGNLSRECYEDMLAFKSSLLGAAALFRDIGGALEDEAAGLSFRLLSLDAAGNPLDDMVEVALG